LETNSDKEGPPSGVSIDKLVNLSCDLAIAEMTVQILLQFSENHSDAILGIKPTTSFLLSICCSQALISYSWPLHSEACRLLESYCPYESKEILIANNLIHSSRCLIEYVEDPWELTEKNVPKVEVLTQLLSNCVCVLETETSIHVDKDSILSAVLITVKALASTNIDDDGVSSIADIAKRLLICCSKDIRIRSIEFFLSIQDKYVIQLLTDTNIVSALLLFESFQEGGDNALNLIQIILANVLEISDGLGIKGETFLLPWTGSIIKKIKNY